MLAIRHTAVSTVDCHEIAVVARVRFTWLPVTQVPLLNIFPANKRSMLYLSMVPSLKETRELTGRKLSTPNPLHLGSQWLALIVICLELMCIPRTFLLNLHMERLSQHPSKKVYRCLYEINMPHTNRTPLKQRSSSNELEMPWDPLVPSPTKPPRNFWSDRAMEWIVKVQLKGCFGDGTLKG